MSHQGFFSKNVHGNIPLKNPHSEYRILFVDPVVGKSKTISRPLFGSVSYPSRTKVDPETILVKSTV